MLKFLTRLIAILALAAGFASFVVDGTRSIAGNELFVTPVADLFKSRLPGLEQGVSRNIHPLLWDPVLLAVLRLPAWFALALIGLLLLRVAARGPIMGRPVRS